MSGSVVLLNLAGAVALLLWATRMVRTGVERAYGDVLRRRLRTALSNPLAGALAGTGLAIALQSATAVALLVGSLVGSGFVGGASGLIAVLGADLGSAIVVKVLSFDLSLLVPVCLFSGTVIFLTTERRSWRQFGRILVGVGLLLLSLRLIGSASEPLRTSSILPVIVDFLAADPITAFILAAITTWLFHSSVAAILLLVALAERGLVPVELGIVMVFGCNLGGGMIAAMLSRSMPAAGRSVPIANLALRGLSAVAALLMVMLISPPVELLGQTTATQIVNAHIVFNLVLVIVGLPLAATVHRLVASALAYLQPPVPIDLEDQPVSALDPSVLDNPPLALGNATREVMAICDTVEIMLTNVMELYEQADKAKILALAALDDRVDERHAAIKLYLARISASQMSEDQALRYQELLGACVKLEQVGDIIVRNMLPQVRKKLERRVEFSDQGLIELHEMHEAVLANARLAFNVLLSRDRETARQLILEKDRMRELEKNSHERHFDRLRQGTAQSVETSSIHLDTIRDLKQINSLLASIAYPVLEEHGLLRDSRLRASYAGNGEA